MRVCLQHNDALQTAVKMCVCGSKFAAKAAANIIKMLTRCYKRDLIYNRLSKVKYNVTFPAVALNYTYLSIL